MKTLQQHIEESIIAYTEWATEKELDLYAISMTTEYLRSSSGFHHIASVAIEGVMVEENGVKHGSLCQTKSNSLNPCECNDLFNSARQEMITRKEAFLK